MAAMLSNTTLLVADPHKLRDLITNTCLSLFFLRASVVSIGFNLFRG